MTERKGDRTKSGLRSPNPELPETETIYGIIPRRITMQDVLVCSWNKLRELKERRGKPTDDDLDSIDSNYDFLVGLLQKKYGYTALTPPKRMPSNGWLNTHRNIVH